MLNEFIILAIAHVIAVASPGADFALVLKNSLRSGLKAGIASAIGVGLGIAVHMTYTLLGVSVIIAKSAFILNLVKWVGTAYLIYLAYLSFKSRPNKTESNLDEHHQDLPTLVALKQGFLVNVFNPKATLFFIALFANIVSITTPLWIQSLYGLWMVVYTAAWFCLVAWGFSRQSVRQWYAKQAYIIDWVMGAFLLSLAFHLLIT